MEAQPGPQQKGPTVAESVRAHNDPNLFEQDAQPDGEPEPAIAEPTRAPLFVDRANAGGTTSCKFVAHIGDSTSTGMMSESYIKDPNARIDALYSAIGVAQATLELFGGRSLVEHRAENENGVMVAQRLRDAGFKGCWVIGLGTCDAANFAKDPKVPPRKRIERLMAIIGDEPVMWIDAVTVVESGYWSAESMRVWNAELAATLADYPNARIYSWSQDMQDDWFVKDGIHYNSRGYAARAGMVATALAAAFPGGH